ncbi:MAG: hypothetical protein ACLUNO_00065 [Oscillospiraceae bacterium]
MFQFVKDLVAFRRCGGERKPNHFLRRHVRRRKYFSACKRARRLPWRTARALQSGRKSLCQKVLLFDSLKTAASEWKPAVLVVV